MTQLSPQQKSIASSMQMAMNHFREGRLDEAEAMYREVLKKAPGHSDASHCLGLIALQRNKYDAAMKLIGEAIQSNPAIPEYYLTLGMAHKRHGRLAQAAELFRVAVQLRADYAEAWLNLASVLAEQGKSGEAEEAYKRVVAVQPGNGAALNGLAQLCLGQKRAEEAEKHIRAAIEANPQDPDAHFNLGNLLRFRGENQEAALEFRRTVELNPRFAEAYQNLGLVFATQGSFREAEKCFRQALKHKSGLHISVVSLGLTLYETERYDDALKCLQKALAMKPHLAVTYNQIGLVHERKGEYDKALEYFDKALALNRDFPDAHYNRGIALAKAMRHAESIEAYRKAIEIKPDFDKAHNNLGYMLIETGRMDEAEAAIRKALELNPDYDAAWNNLGIVLRQKGSLPEGIECFQKALEINPQYAEAHRHLAVSIKYKPDDMAHAKQIEALLESEGLPEERRMHAKFALGKIYDDCKMHEKAFAAYREANDIRKKTFRFDYERHHNYVSQLIETYTDEFFAKRKGFGLADETPVFIIGMPRSGTTMIEQIISSHPQAYGAGELGAVHLLEAAIARELNSETPYPMVARLLDRNSARGIGQGYLKHVRAHSADAKRITDKMPDNFLSVGFIKLVLPKARIIHCRRDPRDSGLSIYFQCFTFGNSYAYDLETIGQYYNEYDRIVSHWRSLDCIDMFEVQYEEMVQNQEEMSRKLIEFVGLDWDERCLSFHETERLVRTASVDQVRRPLYKTSVARWKPYEKYLGPLIKTVKSAELAETA